MTMADRRVGDGGDDAWDVDWEGQRRRQLRSTAATTPAQRLAWLEAAIRLAHRSGALERTRRARQSLEMKATAGRRSEHS